MRTIECSATKGHFQQHCFYSAPNLTTATVETESTPVIDPVPTPSDALRIVDQLKRFVWYILQLTQMKKTMQYEYVSLNGEH